ncbi:MAG: zinc-ribbon domain-containing protein [Bacteroidetes bacterium]|nr:MAG: zinc-ribbon domain-containing protein [Bacteroidota bacterium]
MIIYGWKSTGIGQAQIPEPCPNCSTENSVQMHVFKKYAHVFWIPLFPFGNTAVTECDHCKQVLKKNEFSPQFKERYERLKEASAKALWTWTGTALFAVLVVYSSFASGKHQEELKTFAAEPQINDLYTWKIDGEYTLAKVVQVANDTVYLQFHEYSINKSYKVNRLLSEHPDAFSADLVGIPSDQIPSLVADDTISDIDR